MAHSDSPRTSWFPAERLLLAGLLVFTLLVRGGVLWAVRDNLQQDPDLYREIAENLLRHGEFAVGHGEPGDDAAPVRPTAFRPPLYPVVLSNLPAAGGERISLAKVAVLHLVLGVATVWLTWLTAKRFCRVGQTCRVGPASAARAGPPFDDGRTDNGGPALAEASWSHPTTPGLRAWFAGLLIACDPILLNQQSLVMTETLAAFLAILGLWCLARFDGSRTWFNAALAGGAIGLAVLCRPTFLPWLGLVGLTMLVVRGGPVFSFQFSVFSWRQFGWRLLNAAALGIVAAAMISPWVIRNYRVFGKPIVTTRHGGYTLLLGNNENFYAWLDQPIHDLPWDSRELDVERSNRWMSYSPVSQDGEANADSFYDGWAKRVIRENPRQFIRACLYRLRQLWSPLPNKLTADESASRKLLRYATAAWYCAVYLLAAIGVWRLRWKLLQPPWIWGVLLCLAFTAVHTFYWTNLRMRAPLMPFVAMVAAAAIRIGDKTERWRDRETERE